MKKGVLRWPSSPTEILSCMPGGKPILLYTHSHTNLLFY